MESQAPYGHALRTSCDKCRSAKVKCQREGQSCSRCVQRDEECTTTFLPRKVPKPDRRGRILHMESRIERMESILAASGLADEVATTPATTGSPTTDLDDRLSMLLLHDEGNSTFIGTASNLSLFSPAGLNWITNRTNCSDLSDLVKKRAQEISIFKETCLYPSHVHRGQAPLPPKNVADPLISCYFDTLNSVIPLFRRDKFEQLYVQQYSNNPPKSTSWYASFNVILALGGLLSLDEDIYAISEGSTRTYTAALDYIRNSWHVFTELSLNCRDFMTIQALITMVRPLT
ncbi:hypothetical protein BDV25DRAFT_171856 [Aspergillus avenaceus]|uniref:Zn(2)-C6 fungal-type domain-containing protein n=1 Tax=Aspergillus avenaceus TaxID=36643 RepID=A0A5N6TXS9_ASPAV|nr:hypothetical protein BDV25DRAFT_171856 [Aspergillus avenaceus]